MEAFPFGAFPAGFLWSGLHCASYFAIVEVVVTLIEIGGYDLNAIIGGVLHLQCLLFRDMKTW